MVTIGRQLSEELIQVEKLLDTVFGVSRYLKSSYTLRKGVEPIHALSLTARYEGSLVGTVRFWPILLQDDTTNAQSNALLLGPLAVSDRMRGQRLGRKLIEKGLQMARAAGYRRVFLVGAHAYYSQFGFAYVAPRQISLPDGADSDRLLYLDFDKTMPLPEKGALLSLQSRQVALPMECVA